MKWFGVALGAGFVAATLAAVLTAQTAQAAQGSVLAERLLGAHNLERERVGVPRLAWSARLAGDAQEWADTLARSGRFEHSPNLAEEGENLWMGSAEHYTAEQMVGGFIEEVRHFEPGPFPNVSRTGRWSDVGHYTQLIWRDTREVGCAVARGQRDDVLVCRYWPAGNVIGERVI
jgi:uncharacterized protein YkwD